MPRVQKHVRYTNLKYFQEGPGEYWLLSFSQGQVPGIRKSKKNIYESAHKPCPSNSAINHHLAMTLALSSSKCFDRVSLAVQAVNKGKAPEAAAILRSVRNDAKLMQNELRKYHRKLQRFERGYMNKAEHLTGRINSLYQQEQTLLRQGRELEERIQQHHSQNERHVESRNEAERRYTEASEEEQKARHRREHLEKFYWVPIFNIAAALIEAYEQNGARASEAKAYMERHQQHMNEVNDDITYTNSRIRIVSKELQMVIKALLLFFDSRLK